ncbi:MAG TPA: NAD(P)-binding domain-containing protein, partial [Phycisphaerales bacterium]|nr:NAD(P)-binding domain-containing protein [Phycisphaerales bacterium]
MASNPTRLNSEFGLGGVAPPVRRVAILGVGQMGLVCAGVLGQGGRPGQGAPEVTMWSHALDEAGELTQTRRSPRLPNFELADCVRVTADLGRAVQGADLIVSAIPVQFTRSVWEQFAAGHGLRAALP